MEHHDPIRLALEELARLLCLDHGTIADAQLVAQCLSAPSRPAVLCGCVAPAWGRVVSVCRN